MKDKKQVLEFAGLGGYIRKQKLEEFLAKKFGRQIRVEVMTDHLVFYVPEKVPDEALKSIKEKKRVVLP